MSITLEARKDFVENICRLSLRLAARERTEGADFAVTLTGRTPLYRLTTLWDGRRHPARPPGGWRDEQWDAIAAGLASTPGHEELVTTGLDFLWPLLEPRLARDVAEWPYLPSGVGCDRDIRIHGFFLFERAQVESDTTEMELHMGNTFAPKSPFDEPEARLRDLHSLLEDARERNPRLETIVCGSWLNSFRPFQRFFPPEWMEGPSSPAPLDYSYGVWGQMVSRDGSFHRRNGERFDSTGRLPYPSLTCRCRIDALRDFLAARGVK